GNLFGVIEFYKTALKYGIKPIIGMEAYIAENSLEEKNPNENLSHLTLIAENEKGYKNLLYLSTVSYLKGFYYKPRIDKELLRKNSEGLIALSGCLKGEIPQKILRGDEEGAKKALLEFLDIFGKENFYLELQEIGLEENIIVNKKLLEFAAQFNVNIVATNDVHFLTPQDHLLQDVLICIQTGKKLDDEKRLRIRTNKIYLRSPAEMWEIFGEVEEALTNTLVIAERANVKLELDPTRVHLPKFEIPEGYRDADDFLRQLAVEGLKRKFNGKIPEEYERRLDYELQVMKEMGFSGYFLIIWDLVREARRRGIPVGPGRGSAVGSLVLYALDVTEIDPIRYNLIFERFLNPERISPPDVDMDFSDIKREQLIEYLRNKYGEESVAQIITFGRVMAKGVIRDVARVLGFPYKEADRIAKLIPNGADLGEAMEQVPELKALPAKGEKYKMLFDISRRIEGQIRNISTHAAGLVIAPGKIYEHAPLYKSTDGTISTQFDMKSLEELGLLKIDLLGLRTLTIIDWTVEEVRRRHDPDFRIEDIPLDDQLTYELLSRGETQGIFQLESEGFQNVLRRIKPTKFEDLIAIVALYRPGPIKSGMLESFIRRKRGEEKVEYLHEKLEEVLGETYGVIAYQEQVMQIASTLAGFSMGEADLLRRAMGKKKVEIMEKQRVQFVEGCVKNGISREEAEKIFKAIEPFAGYGFNKSHAAGYALLAYRTAYLKAHYPLEFLTANLSAEMNTQDFQKKIYKFVAEARRLGFNVLP
ncbi:MAG TPA: DNA polymerase III subunit alpha, partial [candidate division WOR-3 bacterium]|nr:DNA polymerase III subunit alpha [candidate division WOR-3 bacterium]